MDARRRQSTGMRKAASAGAAAARQLGKIAKNERDAGFAGSGMRLTMNRRPGWPGLWAKVHESLWFPAAVWGF